MIRRSPSIVLALLCLLAAVRSASAEDWFLEMGLGNTEGDPAQRVFFMFVGPKEPSVVFFVREDRTADSSASMMSAMFGLCWLCSSIQMRA